MTLIFGDLQSFRIDGDEYNCFLTFLREKQFQMLSNESYIEVGHMKTGVLQGSVTDPVLFAGLEKPGFFQKSPTHFF